jgi:hypothetical protein
VFGGSVPTAPVGLIAELSAVELPAAGPLAATAVVGVPVEDLAAFGRLGVESDPPLTSWEQPTGSDDAIDDAIVDRAPEFVHTGHRPAGTANAG